LQLELVLIKKQVLTIAPDTIDTMKSKIQPVIMAGGYGSRLWPLSRTHLPKQFLKFDNQLSPFQQTIIRHSSFAKPAAIINQKHIQIALKQVAEISAECQLIVEPLLKGTALCSILANFIANSQDIEHVILAPSDHLIIDTKAYIDTIERSMNFIDQFPIITIGIKPTNLESSYGYIKCEQKNKIEEGAYSSDTFVEKPSISQAKIYTKDPNFLWNSGIFLYNSRAFLSIAKQHEPKMLEIAHNIWQNKYQKFDIINLDVNLYKQIKKNTIDYAFLEKLKNIVVILARFDWSDLGNFSGFFKAVKKGLNNNLLSYNAFIEDIKNSHLIYDQKASMVMGLKSSIIINNDGSLLLSTNKKFKKTVSES
jgi:mannose-1-phosphate guanylyltransferase/mannose-6-phosphate isomerase